MGPVVVPAVLCLFTRFEGHGLREVLVELVLCISGYTRADMTRLLFACSLLCLAIGKYFITLLNYINIMFPLERSYLSRGDILDMI